MDKSTYDALRDTLADNSGRVQVTYNGRTATTIEDPDFIAKAEGYVAESAAASEDAGRLAKAEALGITDLPEPNAKGLLKKADRDSLDIAIGEAIAAEAAKGEEPAAIREMAQTELTMPSKAFSAYALSPDLLFCEWLDLVWAMDRWLDCCHRRSGDLSFRDEPEEE